MENFIVDLSVLLVGAAVLSCLAVVLKQPLVIAYILCGVILGPWGLGLLKNIAFIDSISHLGITLLLFLAGLCLHPQKLLGLFKKTTIITLTNCLISFFVSFSFALAFKFNLTDSLFIGLAMMFSSTILVVKLLPTTTLHQKRMGALCISILIFQDLLAVAVLAYTRSMNYYQNALFDFLILFVKLLFFVGALILVENFILRRVMHKVEQLHEVLFILGLAWCFGIASISKQMGLFYETGAFFAGVVLARHKISFFISEKLKPLRDFFLVLFFFSLGAKFDILSVKGVLVPAVLLSITFVLIKPWIFKKAFVYLGENNNFSKETGFRLGQLSEFSILIALLALELGHISNKAAQFIQFTTILTFIISSYIVVYSYPTPIGTSDKLIRD